MVFTGFTKGYSKFSRGAGSVLQTVNPPFPHPIARDLATLKACKLRYFTPKEVANLHGFPKSFSFTTRRTVEGSTIHISDVITKKQQYGLLGNSLSVAVVSALLKYLIID